MDNDLTILREAMANLTQGCNVLLESQTLMTAQIDNNQKNIREITAWIDLVDTRIAKVNERIDIYNKRVRKLEQESKRQREEMRQLWREVNAK